MKITKVETFLVRWGDVSLPVDANFGAATAMTWSDATPPCKPDGGCLVVPEGAGLGLTIDEAMLARRRVDLSV